MTSNPIFGVAVLTFFRPSPPPTARNAAFVLPCKSEGGPSADIPPHQEGTIVAKNKNQNHGQEQRDERRGATAEPAERARSTPAKDPVMPAVTPAGHRQQKRFGHN
jgi:hypothetical protein